MSEKLEYNFTPLFWKCFPIISFIILATIAIINKEFYVQYIEGELGFIENATVALLIPGIIAGFLCFKHLSKIPSPLARMAIIALTFGCIYFAGEEASWGQHWFGWKTEGVLLEINDQQETNLHNISSWLDQKPRLLLELWIIIGGAMYPLWRYLKNRPPHKIDSFHYWFWPDKVCYPAAFFVLIVPLPERISKITGTFFDGVRLSEMQEYFFSIFLTCYLISALKRLRAKS